MNTALSARDIWQGFHWTFFIDVQGLILSLLRFEKALTQSDLPSADTELRCAACLLKASGAAMQLGGSFSAEAYNNEVRQSMTPPHVTSEHFSGLMSWDHARLIRLWQRLGPQLGALPDDLSDAHGAFLQAYVEMTSAHSAVCSRFVGESGGSLRSSDPAVGILEKVLRHRLRIIDPRKTLKLKCPFSGRKGSAR